MFQILDSIHKMEGEKALEEFELYSHWDRENDCDVETLATFRGQVLCEGYWFTVNDRNKVVIISATNIQNHLAKKFEKETPKIVSELSDK